MTTATSAATACRCEGVSKWFGDLNVLDRVGLEIPAGAFVSILGPSGCGKTTLLRAIAGLTSIDQGEITVNGRRVDGPPEGVAMVFQGFGLMPWKTIYDNVAYGLVVRGVSRREIAETVPRYLEMVNLTGFEKRYPYQVSGGMRQRAGLARALAINPSVLLMDEPFASVDAQTREMLHDELLAIWERERKSVVFVTHSIDEAIVLSDVVLVMSRRPARVMEILKIDIPRPRRERTARSDSRYAAIREHCWELLEEARDGEQP